MKGIFFWGPVFQGKYFKTFFGGLICPIRVPVWGPIPGPEIDHNRISKGDAIVALVTSLSSQIMILYYFFETPKSPQTVPQIGLNFGSRKKARIWANPPSFSVFRPNLLP
mgnify:CR=1 FL=1